VFVWMCGTQTSAVCLSEYVGLRQVLCVCLDVWDSDKRCLFVWMCGTPTSDVCLSGCVGLRQVLCVCLDVWNSDKCCLFVWMCGTQARAVCLLCLFTVSVASTVCVGLGKVLCFSGCVGLRQVLCVCLDVWDSDKCCVFVWRQTHSTYLSPTHADKHTALV
jgi:hypothetical protein